MENRKVHASSLKVVFGAKTKMPSDSEIFAFFRKRNWSCEMLNAMFREPKELSVYVMFRTEDLMRTELMKCPVSDTFQYDNGQTATVTFAPARGDFKYVRIFGLPIEVDDKHVAATMAKYGKIQHMVRERYGVDTGFPILNGVRGVHIEMAVEIPAQIYVQHFQAKVYYEGMSSKCFVCGGTDHIKANCPKRVSVNDRLKQHEGKLSYANSVILGPQPRLTSSGDLTASVGERATITDPSEEVGAVGGAVESDAITNVPCEAAAFSEENTSLQLSDLVAKDKVNGDPAESHSASKSIERKEVKAKEKEGKLTKRSHSSEEGSSSTSDSEGGKVNQISVPAVKDLVNMQGRRSRSKQAKYKK